MKADSKPQASPGARANAPPERPLAVLAFVVAMLAFLVHRTAASALGPGDERGVLEHELVGDPSLDSARALVAEAFDEGSRAPDTLGARGAQRPLALLSLQLDAALGAGPRNVSAFRRTSVVLHALNAGLLVVLLAFLFGDAWAAAAAGLAFALHPLTVEPVLWLSERGTLLGTLFVLLSSIAYVRWAREGGGARVAAFVAYVLALFANPACAALPLVLLAFDAWPLGRFGARAVLAKLPWLVLGAAAVLALGPVPSAGPSLVAHDLAHHTSKLAWPAELSIVYPLPGASFEADALARAGRIGLGLLAVVLGLGCVLRRPLAFALGVGALAFVAWLVPALGSTDGIGLDSFGYLPAVGLALPLAFGLGALARPGRARAARYALVALVALGLAYPLAVATRARQADWATSEALYGGALEVAPDAPAAHALFAEALASAGRPDEAVRAYQDALARDPFTPGAWHDLGRLLLDRGDLAGALEAYENAAGLFPENTTYAVSRARAVALSGDPESALELLRLAVELAPDDAAARHELGLRLLVAGRDNEAEEHLAAAVRLAPRLFEARASYARFLIGNGRWAEAKVELEAGLALDAGDHELHNNLAIVLTELGDEAGALEHAELTARLRTDLADVQHNLGNALARSGKHQAALAAYDRALAIAPDLLPTLVNRALLLNEMGRRDEALLGLERAVALAPDNEELASMLERLRSGG